MVLKGVKLLNKDNNSITVKTYPSKAGYEYKLTKHTWKNYCPLCKKQGTLVFNPKKVDEGEITCNACDADYCGTTGQDKNKKVRAKLTPATVTGSNNAHASTETQSHRCQLTLAESKTKAKTILNTTNEYSGKLEVPADLKIKPDDLLSIEFTGNHFKQTQDKTLTVKSCKLDIDSSKLEINLLKGRQVLGTPYEGDYITLNSKGAIIATNRNKRNPLKAKPTSINPNIGGFNEQSPEIKKIMLKGKALGTLQRAYEYLKVKNGGGIGGFQYQYYLGHKIKSEKETSIGQKSLVKCWKTKRYNCVDGSWLFHVMCKGLGKKIDIVKAEYTGLDGVKRYHMYNRYKGKTYDVSQNMKTEVDGSRIVKVTK